MGNSPGSGVTHRPTAAEINRCRVHRSRHSGVLVNIVPKQGTLCGFLRHTRRKISASKMTKLDRNYDIAYEWKMYDAFCKQISAHELNHRPNGDKSPRGYIDLIWYRIAWSVLLISDKNNNKLHRIMCRSRYMTSAVWMREMDPTYLDLFYLNFYHRSLRIDPYAHAIHCVAYMKKCCIFD